MGHGDKRDAEDTVALAVRLRGIVSGSWMSQVTFVAVELGLPDLLVDGPRRSDELAAASGAHAPSLHRLMRALTTIDICRECDDGRFELTEMGTLLRPDVEGSVRAWTRYWGAELVPAWGRLLDTVKTGDGHGGEPGETHFERIQRHPEVAELFNQAMSELTWLMARRIIECYDFSGKARIVDVGGGCGELLAAILTAHPHARGVLFDLPHAIAAAPGHLARTGVSERCELVAGSFFESVPGGGDLYVVKNVIHDWDDARARRLLESCRRAMGEGARLLVIDQLLPTRLDSSMEHQALVQLDLLMLLNLAARVRTEAELRALLESAGLRVTRAIPAGLGCTILEAVPAPL
jgi:hypothetical protein